MRAGLLRLKVAIGEGVAEGQDATETCDIWGETVERVWLARPVLPVSSAGNFCALAKGPELAGQRLSQRDPKRLLDLAPRRGRRRNHSLYGNPGVSASWRSLN